MCHNLFCNGDSYFNIVLLLILKILNFESIAAVLSDFNNKKLKWHLLFYIWVKKDIQLK